MSRASADEAFARGLSEYQARRFESAASHFRAALARSPRHAEALHHLGLVTQLTGHPRLALPILQQSVAAKPRDAIYALNLGNLFYQLGRFSDAIDHWKRAARIKPAFEDAWNNIGLLLFERGDHGGAAEAFHRLTKLNPVSSEAFRRLGQSLRGEGRPAEAREALQRARALTRDPDALKQFGCARAVAGRPEAAIRAFRRAVRISPERADLHYELADAFLDAGRPDDARRACRRVLALDASHWSARVLLAVLDGQSPSTLPPEHVKAQFDSFAPRFERHLVEELNYRGPELLVRAVKSVLPVGKRRGRWLRVLDAGCGTGLAAPLLRPIANRLSGVDLSPGMLARARERRLYDALIAGDLVGAMRRRPRRFDLVFAADVFIYVGELAGPFRAAHRALVARGLLAFTAETADGNGCHLQPSQRYTHSLAYIRQTARQSGFAVRRLRTATLRYEYGAPVHAAIVVLQKT